MLKVWMNVYVSGYVMGTVCDHGPVWCLASGEQCGHRGCRRQWRRALGPQHLEKRNGQANSPDL